MKIKLTCFHILILIGLVVFAIFWSRSINKANKTLLKSHEQLMKQPNSITQPTKIKENTRNNHDG